MHGVLSAIVGFDRAKLQVTGIHSAPLDGKVKPTIVSSATATGGEGLQKYFTPLFLNKTFSDVTIIVGEEKAEFPAHKVLLSAVSPRFAAQLFPDEDISSIPTLAVTGEEKKDEKDGKIERKVVDGRVILTIPGVKTSQFLIILRTIYTGQALTPDELKEADELLVLANKFKVPSLLAALGNHFKNGVKPENACESYDRLLKVDVAVGEAVGEFIRRNAIGVFKTPGFVALSPHALKLLLALDLNIPEIDVFKSVVAWGKKRCEDKKVEASTENLQKEVADLIPLIRFPLLNVTQLSTEVVPTKLVPNEHLIVLFTYVAKKGSSTEEIAVPEGLPYSAKPRKK